MTRLTLAPFWNGIENQSTQWVKNELFPYLNTKIKYIREIYDRVNEWYIWREDFFIIIIKYSDGYILPGKKQAKPKTLHILLPGFNSNPFQNPLELYYNP